MRNNWMIRQGWVVLAMMLVPMVLSLFSGDHNSLTQHMSEYEAEVGLLPAIARVSTMVAGVSIALFAVGCLFISGRFRLSWSFLVTLVFGLAMLSNGVFVTGSPWHGLYGLAVFLILVPAAYAAEFGRNSSFDGFVGYSLFTAVVGLLYIWMLVFGLDPDGLRGLTQRVASLVSFGWFAIAALTYRTS